jgi:hypothetical protein
MHMHAHYSILPIQFAEVVRERKMEPKTNSDQTPGDDVSTLSRCHIR